MPRSGQALVELALCLPLLLLLGGTAWSAATLVQAREELDLACAAAASSAARAPDASAAQDAARIAFAQALSGDPPQTSNLRLDLGAFQRGGVMEAYASAVWPVGSGLSSLLPLQITLVASSAAVIEPWRSR